jgi:single-strand DNA-binding protein
MKGIECALEGVLGKDPELKVSKGGTPYAGLNIVVTVGKDDDGKDVGQWLRVTCFKEVAEHVAATAKKGSRLYVEGSLTLSQWNDQSGEVRHGLNVAAWRAVVLGQIGQRRPKQTQARKSSGPNDTKPADHGAAKKDGREFDDALPF